MVAVAVFLALCLVPLWVPELRAPVRLVPLLALHVVVSPLLLVGARHQAKIERENRVELERMDARMADVERLEVLVRAAGSAAHDFNNLIFVIDANARSLASKLRETAAVEIEKIGMAVQRAPALSRQLLTSSRDGASRVRLFDPIERIRSFGPLLARLAGERVRLDLQLNHASSPIRMDPLQLEQVLMNLVINARDAMPEGGTVVITCTDIVLDDVYLASNSGASAGQHIVITVADSGKGIDSATLEHTFEPFFTTKPTGRGTGLGLAIVPEVIERSGGHVTVHSAPGRGATFRCYLPARSQDG